MSGKVNFFLATAAFLTIAIGAAHSILGERYILIRLFRRADLPHLFGSDAFTRQTIRFAWHLTTVAWYGFAVLLGMASTASEISSQTRGALLVIAATSLVSSALALVATRGRHFSWAVFLAIAIATWLGAR